jgi:hypothetical protein
MVVPTPIYHSVPDGTTTSRHLSTKSTPLQWFARWFRSTHGTTFGTFRALKTQPAARIEDEDDDEYENDKGQRVTHAVSPSRQTPNEQRYPAR